MQGTPSSPARHLVRISLAVAAFAALTGAAFAAWVDNGTAIFVTMVESGLSWCF
ncbi:MAG: hypothetical protein AB7S80_19410 [Rhizobiaceae bacterium]